MLRFLWEIDVSFGERAAAAVIEIVMIVCMIRVMESTPRYSPRPWVVLKEGSRRGMYSVHANKSRGVYHLA